MKIKKRERKMMVDMSNYKRVNGKLIRKKLISLRNFGKKSFFVAIFLGLGHWLDFPKHIISIKNFVVILLAVVTIILYDEFGWSILPSYFYELEVGEKKRP